MLKDQRHKEKRDSGQQAEDFRDCVVPGVCTATNSKNRNANIQNSQNGKNPFVACLTETVA